MRTIKQRIGLGVLAMTLAASPLLAQGRGNGKEKDKGRDNDCDRRRDCTVVQRSNGDVSRVPPGLAKKPGGMPPGQYKKLYHPNDGVVVMRDVFARHHYTVVRTAPYGTSQYVYYRAPDGVLRRAIVSPGTDRLAFSNVPGALLQEILARLY